MSSLVMNKLVLESPRHGVSTTYHKIDMMSIHRNSILEKKEIFIRIFIAIYSKFFLNNANKFYGKYPGKLLLIVRNISKLS